MRELVVLGPRGARWRCEVPTTSRERARGLRRRPDLGREEALLLWRCTSVHTFGMRAPVAIVRLDRSLVVRDVRVLRPGRIRLPTWRRGHVLECVPESDVRVGDRFAIARDV